MEKTWKSWRRSFLQFPEETGGHPVAAVLGEHRHIGDVPLVQDMLQPPITLQHPLKVRALVKEEMESAASLAVPMEVDAKTGKDWGEAH